MQISETRQNEWSRKPQSFGSMKLLCCFLFFTIALCSLFCASVHWSPCLFVVHNLFSENIPTLPIQSFPFGLAIKPKRTWPQVRVALWFPRERQTCPLDIAVWLQNRTDTTESSHKKLQNWLKSRFSVFNVKK